MFFYKEVVNNNNNPLSLNLDLSNIVFSDTLINGEATGSVTISATGTGTETITITDNSGEFNASPASFSLSGGSSQIVSLIFSPTSTGNKTGTVTISASGGNSSQLTLSGSGSQFVETQILFATSVGASAQSNSKTSAISSNGQKLFVGSQQGGYINIYNNVSGSFQFEELIELGEQWTMMNANSLGCNSDGSILVVGCETNKQLKIYKNNLGSWSLVQTISEPEEVDFGRFVAINASGNTIATIDLQDEGKTFVYQYNGSSWIQETTIGLSNYLNRTVYNTGGPLRINSSGDRLFLGCINESGDNEIHILNKMSGTWNYSHGITNTPSIWNSQYPSLQKYIMTEDKYLAINSNGNKLAIPIMATDENTQSWPEEHYGVAIYNSSSGGWSVEQIVTASMPSGAIASPIGYYCSFNALGDCLIVGAPRVGPNGETIDGEFSDWNNTTGVVYIFIKNIDSWVLSQILTSSIPTVATYFGESLHIDAQTETIIVNNSNVWDAATVHQGAAYVFKKQ